MGDFIDELVDWQLNEQTYEAEQLNNCPNACGNRWHGTPTRWCPGSHVRISKELVRHADHQAWQVNLGI